MKQITFAMLCATALLFTSCSKDDSPATPPNTSTSASDYWMPTAAGSRLVFETVDVSKVGTVTMDSSVGSLTFTMLPGTKTMKDGKTAFIVQTISTSKTITDTALGYLVLSAASIVMYDDSLTAERAITQLKAPLTVGNSWLPAASDTTHFTIASISETVSTPAGTFQNCIRVHTVGPYSGDIPMTEDIYFAKGIGLVKFAWVVTTTIASDTYTMTSTTTLKSKNF
jgi:hypothetical protein